MRPYHQETLDAISRSETNIANKVQNLELQLSNQSDYIESLEDEIITLSSQLDIHLTSIEHKVIDELEEEEPVAVTAVPAAPTSQPTILGELKKYPRILSNKALMRVLILAHHLFGMQ